MPRHRKAFPRRHRAQRQADEPERRVPADTAIAAAQNALESACQPDAWPSGRARPPLAAPQPRPGRPPAGARPGGGPGARGHLLPGLLVTPWFAAGAGVVIAAALFLNAPHAVLSFAPAPDYVTSCQPDCVSAAAVPTAGSLTNARPGVQIAPPRPAAPRARPSAGQASSVTGVRITFQVQWQQGGAFGALVTVRADHDISGWTVAFAIPAARISHVLGASWQPSATGNGGTATDPAGGQGRSGQGGQSPSPEDSARFVIIANGSPARPVDCVFDGASCHFRLTAGGLSGPGQ